MLIPTEDQAREFLKKYSLPERLIKHSEEVSKNSVLIAAQIEEKSQQKTNTQLLKVGGLLHDIGRQAYFSMESYPYESDFHEYETGKLLKELGYQEFGEIIQRHPLGGLTPVETKALGYPEYIDLMPNTIESKIICIADKIRLDNDIITLANKITDYRTNQRLSHRYFSKLPGLLEVTIERVESLWHELEDLGMRIPLLYSK